LTVTGTNLGTESTTYMLADIDVAPLSDVTVTATRVGGQNGSVVDATTKLATKLVLAVPAQANLNFVAGHKYRFTIINSDSEKSQGVATAT